MSPFSPVHPQFFNHVQHRSLPPMTTSTAVVDDGRDTLHKRLPGQSGVGGRGGVVAGLFLLRRSLGNQLLIALCFVSILAALHILIERHELRKAAELAFRQSAAKMCPLSVHRGTHEGTTVENAVPVVSYSTIAETRYTIGADNTPLEDEDDGKGRDGDRGSHTGLELEAGQLSYTDDVLFSEPLDDPATNLQQKLNPEMERKFSLNDRPPPPPTKIFDFIMLNDELDELELRLQELELDVDLFFVIESDTTFSGRPKPLYFRENRARFQRYLEKIVHIVVPGPQKPPLSIEDVNHMEKSGRQPQEEEEALTPLQTIPLKAERTAWKEYLETINDWEARSRSQGLFMALDIHRPDENDWILLADLDEIPRPKTLQAFRTQEPLGPPLDHSVSLVRLLCDSYHYSYEFKVKEEKQEAGPMMIRFMEHSTVAEERTRQAQLPLAFQDPSLDILFELSENDWKVAGGRLREMARSELRDRMLELPKSCWHCSCCFATMRQVRTKLDADSHADLNKKEFRVKDWILPNLQYEYVADNTDVPSTVILNKDRYKFMLEREDRDDAGFTDELTNSDAEDDG